MQGSQTQIPLQTFFGAYFRPHLRLLSLHNLTDFEEIFKHLLSIGSHVKTMPADGGHFGWRSGSPDTIWGTPKDYFSKVWSHWLWSFRQKDFLLIFFSEFSIFSNSGHSGWKGTTQQPFHQSLVQIGSVVSEELISEHL